MAFESAINEVAPDRIPVASWLLNDGKIWFIGMKAAFGKLRKCKRNRVALPIDGSRVPETHLYTPSAEIVVGRMVNVNREPIFQATILALNKSFDEFPNLAGRLNAEGLTDIVKIFFGLGCYSGLYKSVLFHARLLCGHNTQNMCSVPTSQW